MGDRRPGSHRSVAYIPAASGGELGCVCHRRRDYLGPFRAYILGEDKFRKLALLTVASELSKDKSPELLFLALQRANFCELAAHALNQDPSEQYLFGLISLLPALLGTSVKQVADMLPLSTPVKAAMMGESNGIAAALYSMKRYEMGEDSGWEDGRYRLRDQDVERWYHESLLRAEHAVRPQVSA